MAAAPAASSSSTVRATLIGSPNPVSASTITGNSTRRVSRRVSSVNSPSVNSPMSGIASE